MEIELVLGDVGSMTVLTLGRKVVELVGGLADVWAVPALLPEATSLQTGLSLFPSVTCK